MSDVECCVDERDVLKVIFGVDVVEYIFVLMMCVCIKDEVFWCDVLLWMFDDYLSLSVLDVYVVVSDVLNCEYEVVIVVCVREVVCVSVGEESAYVVVVELE